jgi:3-hydroxybutyryl-CoA dehydrogenase
MSISAIGVVGAGTMGAGIAQVAASTGFRVSLIDVNENSLSKAMERISSGFDRAVKKGQIAPETKQAATSLINTAKDYDILTPADLIVEAATENADVKTKIVQAVDKAVRAEKLGCNHPIGPLALADLIGLDVLLSVMEVLHHELGDSKYRPCPNLREMVEAGYLGRKSGRGVYQY